MQTFKNKIISSNISRFQVLIKKTDNYDVEGTLYNEFYEFAIDFKGIRQLLEILDQFFDYINFHQATHKKRSFDENQEKISRQPPPGLRDMAVEDMPLQQANLILHVLLRQYSTWQGILQWLEKSNTTRFRSELELIKLLAQSLE
ncbi:MAG: hypothetical protein ACOX7H_08365 [Bacillota bacterium]|jgi:hypothetical protein